MEIKDIEKALSDALQAPEDEVLRSKYCASVADYLKENKSSDEVVSIVICGIDLDRAANYFDFLEGVSKNDLQSIWKQVRRSKELKEGQADHVLKFLAGMLAMSFMKAGNMSSLCGSVVTALVGIITDGKNPVSDKIYGPILCDYVFDDLNPREALPQWDTIRASDEVCQQFAEILLKVTDGENAERYKPFRQWANRGLRYIEEQIKKKKIEEKIPESKIANLTAIVEHYKAVEKQLRDSIYEIARLQDEMEELQKEVGVLHGEKRDLEGQNRTLSNDINAKQQQLDKAEKEVRERAAINEAFGALKKNDESALLNDIADELKTDYQDFVASELDEMDVVLGEIYREKLKNIFKILGKKGIRME